MSEKRNISVEEIANKAFQTVDNGYRAEEVDGFLDEVNESYANSLKIIDQQNKTINEKNLKIEQLNKELSELKEINHKIQQQQSDEVKGALSSRNMVKKISNIEGNVNRILSYIESNKK